jgi:hypothetical protein
MGPIFSVGAFKIPDKYLIFPDLQGAMAITDKRAGRAEMTMLIPADQELGKVDGNGLAFHRAFGQYDQT